MTGLRVAMLLLAAFAATVPAAARTVHVRGDRRTTLTERGNRTVLHLAGASIPLDRGGPCDPCRLQDARLLGKRPRALLAFVATYASQTYRPGGQCGAGEEEVLHVLSLRPRPHLVDTVLLSSCWNDAQDTGTEPAWDAATGRLTAERYDAEHSDVPERFVWRVGPDGGVVRETPHPSSR